MIYLLCTRARASLSGSLLNYTIKALINRFYLLFITALFPVNSDLSFHLRATASVISDFVILYIGFQEIL